MQTRIEYYLQRQWGGGAIFPFFYQFSHRPASALTSTPRSSELKAKMRKRTPPATATCLCDILLANNRPPTTAMPVPEEGEGHQKTMRKFSTVPSAMITS